MYAEFFIALFVLSFLGVFYTYVIYPILLMILKFFKHIDNYIHECNNFPHITIIIAAHNEEHIIREKIENGLLLDYPKTKIDIIVSSDCSTDKTNDIVKSYVENGVRLINHEIRRGKSQGLNIAVPEARGEIIVFNDATTMLERSALRAIVKQFCEPHVGAVACRLTYSNASENSTTRNESLYFRYEEWLRKQESSIGALCAVSGACYAIRKDLYTNVPLGSPDDCVSPVQVNLQGFRVAYVDSIVITEELATSPEGVVRIKRRGITRELNGLFFKRRIFNVFKYPLQSFVIFSHRIMRYLSSFLFLLIFLSSILLSIILSSPFWIIISLLQICLCLCTIISSTSLIRKLPLCSIIGSFVTVNIAAILGVFDFLSAKDVSTWTSVRRETT
jgi:cellulose synthase/poly-beta-1,6-N-acetylglucosamine synthase-like glycosyltransferase